MTVSVFLRNNQPQELSWSQMDANFSSLAAAVNANTAALANIGGAVGGPTRPATPTLYQSFFDSSLGFTVWCSQVTPSVIWVDAAGASV